MYLRHALEEIEAIESQLLGLLDSSDPYSPQNILAHATIISLYHEMRLAWRVEAAYRRFLAWFADDPLDGWRVRAEADPQYEDQTRDAFLSLVKNVIDALAMRNPADRTEIERLQAQIPPAPFAPLVLPYDPDVFALPDLPRSEFAEAAGALTGVAAALGAAGSARAAAVLGAWAGFARRGLLEFRDLAEGLAGAEPDEEALGVLVRGLRGRRGTGWAGTRTRTWTCCGLRRPRAGRWGGGPRARTKTPRRGTRRSAMRWRGSRRKPATRCCWSATRNAAGGRTSGRRSWRAIPWRGRAIS